MNTLLRGVCKIYVFHPGVLNEPLGHQLQGLPRQLLPAELRQKRHLHLILYLYNTVLISTIGCKRVLTLDT